MFCHVRFHPSAAGYREIARILLHGVLAALDLPRPAAPEQGGPPLEAALGDPLEGPLDGIADGSGDALTA